MLRSMLFLIGGLLGGWLLAASWSPAPPGSSRAPEPAPGPTSVVERIETLESALAAERERRLGLADELDALEASVARLEQAPGADGLEPARGAPSARAEGAAREAAPGAAGGRDAERAGTQRERRRGRDDERRVERLVDAGFAPDRAQWIVRREAELRMDVLQARYEARRTGEPLGAAAAADASTLRTELGEADYDRYLDAMGAPTSVGVRDVLAGSPAERAGLEAGDRLVRYGGERIYDTGDLNALTVEGSPGEPVTVDVVRDGQTIQLVMPRGPLGITGGGRYRPTRR